MSKIRVAISATLEVDAEDWNLAYGTGTEAAAIREDVKTYFRSVLQEYNDSVTVVKFR